MVLKQGVLDGINGRHIGVLDQHCVEEPSGITFGTFQLLGNEHSLSGKILVDYHGLSTDGGSTY